MRMRNALLLQPFMDFPISDHGSACATGQLYCIGYMILVAVRKKDIIRMDIFQFDHTTGVPVDQGTRHVRTGEQPRLGP